MVSINVNINDDIANSTLKDCVNTCTVNYEHAMKLNDFFKNDHLQKICFNTTSSFLFGKGLKVVENENNKIKPTPELEFLINNIWTGVSKEALVELYIYGYVLWCPVDSDVDSTIFSGKRAVSLPQIVPRQLYDLKIKTLPDYSRVYEVVLRNRLLLSQSITGDKDGMKKEMHLFLMPGYSPDPITGQHQSIVSSLYDLGVYTKAHDHLNLRAVGQSSHPPIMFERDVDILGKFSAPDATSTHELNIDSILNGVIHKNPASAVKDLTRMEEVEAGNQVNAPRLEIDDVNESLLSRGKRTKIMHTQTPEDNVHFVPIGYKMAQHQPSNPEPYKDYARIVDYYRDSVFATYQVPVGICFPMLNVKSGSSVMVHIDDNEKLWFNRTLRNRQALIISLCKQFYVVVYKTKVVEVDISLPLVVNATLTQIYTLMDQNTISEEDGKTIILDLVGIEEKFIFDGQNKNDRPRPNGNEGTVQKVIDATVEDRLASAELKRAEVERMSAEIVKLKAEAISIKRGDNKKKA